MEAQTVAVLEEPMRSAGAPPAPAPDETAAAIELRDAFLTDPDGTELSALRPIIARSWRRSSAWNTSLDYAPVPREPEVEEWVLDSAEPAIRRLLRAAHDRGGCVVMADRFGTVTSLRGARQARHRAEEFFAPAGTSLAEDVAGTNCIGTAIEEERGLIVIGCEHLSSRLDRSWSCSALVRDPLRGSLRAVLGLVLPLATDGGTIPEGLSALVERAAAEVADVLAARLAAREQALLTAYLRQLRKRGSGAVLAIDGRTSISSTGALEMLDPRAQPVLAAYAQEARRAGCALRRELSLDDGTSVDVCIDPVSWGAEVVGSVLTLRPAGTGSTVRRTPTPRGEAGPFADMVGESPAFARAIEHGLRAVEREAPTLIVGAAGTGKRMMAIAIATAWQEGPHLVAARDLVEPGKVVELASVLERGGAAVILRADLAPQAVWTEVAALTHGRRPARLVITAGRLPESAAALLLTAGSMQIEMPSLRARRDDIPALVSTFLAAVDGPGQISSRLLKTLTETDLPGNVAQLREIVTGAAPRCSTAEITPDDLTAEHRQALMRTTLPPLQAAEVTEIQQALREAGGNRMRAAEILRIGRSTLYRRLEKYSRLGYDL
ncbi:MAG: hypothetical protein JST53_01815 [Actinobacteria bacterium]|nr:hypothetical protein [Actinomycetota bacterium]